MTDLRSDARRANRSAAVVLVLLLAGVLLAGVVAIVVSWSYLTSQAHSRSTAPPSAPRSTGPSSAPAATAPARSAAPRAHGRDPAERRWPLPPDMDLTKVEPRSLFEPARRLARSFDPLAELSPGFPFVAYYPVRGGVVDLTGSGFMHFEYAWSYTDASKPPGEDLVQGKVSVRYQDGALVAHKSISMGDEPVEEIVPDPICPATKAWQAAVVSGVPENAVAKLLYYDSTPFGPSGPYVWSFRVDGHDELRRDIDAETCALVKSWAKR